MRRYSRPSGGPTMHAARINGSTFPDPLTLIRAYDSESNPTRPVRPSPLTASTIQGLPLDLLDRLRSFPLFLSAPDSFLLAVCAHLRPQVYSPHDYILTEGHDAKAMYWLVRGSVRVTSRDGESTYAELKPGAFFGEIGILMDIPRTATIIANMRCLVVRLNKEDLKKELPVYPEVERAIRDEAKERLAVLEKKKKENKLRAAAPTSAEGLTRNAKRPRDRVDGDIEMGDAGMLRDGELVGANKKRKSPSPSLVETSSSSALGTGSVSIRPLLKELPLFSRLPPEILHFLGLRAQPRSFPPFHEIIRQGSTDKDVYFIVKGEVEVVVERSPGQNGHLEVNAAGRLLQTTCEVKARLKPGQYFGEVTSLLLSPRRTATVRSVTSVECLMISDDVLNELWRQSSPDIRQQVESVAKQRLETATDADIAMTDVAESTIAIDGLEIGDQAPRTPRKKSIPSVTFNDEPPITPTKTQERTLIEPFDPDPFLNPDLDNMRSRSRRNSLAPPTPTSPDGSQTAISESPKSPTPLERRVHASQAEPVIRLQRPRRPKVIRRSSRFGKGILPDAVLVGVFKHLDLVDLMRLRLVSLHWMKVLSSSPDILHYLDLSKYNRLITDSILSSTVCPFVGNRPRVVDLSNCFHISDGGFASLAEACGENVKTWKMKSVWDITGQAVLDMVGKAKGLEEIDLSNCRKVGDNLLARVVGWVVPDVPAALLQQQANMNARAKNGRHGGQQQQPQPLPPGTVVGCPRLKRLTLSYCKHITDRSMAHIAVHASQRLESMDLTRCTTITDGGFQHWSVYPFPLLSKLCLADCTYLTDNAIVYLTNAAKQLRELDLSFCCALSDTATEVLALGCPNLTHLNMAFCGSAVSDSSLGAIALHLLDLRELSVRGCVRVTGAGVESVVDGCPKLEYFDVSQCKNLTRWLDNGGIARRGRGVRFDTVTDGKWRNGQR